MSPVSPGSPGKPGDAGKPGSPEAPQYAAATDVGLVRANNEDSYLIAPPLFAVADGMGGHRAGEVASAGAIATLEQEAGHDTDSLVAAVHAANRAVYDQATGRPELAGMGTTMTAMLTTGSAVQIVHVGDSRAYMLRDGRLRRLTQDHTVVDRLAREGKITAQEVGQHPQRSVLERALGVGAEVHVDVHAIDVHPGDRLLLCTDGLTSMLPDAAIQAILEQETDPKRASERLIAEALAAGGKDNVTAVVVDFPGATPRGIDPNVTMQLPASSFKTAPPEEGRRRIPPGDGTTRLPAVRGAPPGGFSAGSPRPPVSSAYVPPDRGRAGGRAGERVGERTMQSSLGGPPGAKPGDAAPAKGRPPWLRPVIWVAVLVPLLVIGGLAAWAGIRSSWYVGQSSGQVAIFQGVPGSFAGIKMSSVAATTSVSVASLPADYQRRIRAGITAKNKADAQQIAGNLAQLIVQPTPASTPSPAPVTQVTPTVTAPAPGHTP